jgi:cytoskeleton protein RodZ
MSTETEPTPENSDAAIAAMVLEPPGFGARLRAARESTGRTAAEVADKLHCDASIIAALEAENLPALGAAVYARGHLRRYAEFLSLPGPELVALYDLRKDHPGSVPDLTRIAKAERPRDPNRALRWVYVVAAGVIGLFAVWWVLQSPRGAANSPAPAAASQVAPPPPPAAASVSQPAPAGEPAPASAPLPMSGAATANATPGSGAATAAKAPAAASAADARIVRLGFRTQAECWVEVYDKDGRQLFFDLARRGTRQDVAGAGPLRLVLGNAPAIRFELAGKELTVPAALQRKSTAFITISADGRIEQAR